MTDEPPSLTRPISVRSIWISDVHLGTKHARVADLLALLRDLDCRYLYIVGDLIDGWELKHKWYWRDDYNVLIQKLLRKSRKQTRVVYITGNHDEFLEEFTGMAFGRVTLARQVIHVGADGRRYLVIHGHQADGITQFNRLLDRVGSRLYNWILDFNHHFNRFRRALGFGYWSIAAALKMKAKAAVKYISEYEETLVQMARKQQAQGVICGHIHRAEIRTIGDIQYLNCGDWVESCTALVEDFDGTMRLIHFHQDSPLRSGHTELDGADPDSVRASADQERRSRRHPATTGSGLLCFGDETKRDTRARAELHLE